MTAKNGFKFVTCAAITFVSAGPAFAGQINYGAQQKKVALAESFQQPMQCVIDKLKQRSGAYIPKDVGCFGTRPNNPSAHPTGHACDVDQTGRDKTALNGSVPRPEQIQIAEGCEAVSGCVWRNPDCGHFEQRSAPYSPSGTGTHYYGEGYADHHVSPR